MSLNVQQFKVETDRLAPLTSQLARMGGEVELNLNDTLKALQNRDIIKIRDIATQKNSLTPMRRSFEQDAGMHIARAHFYGRDLRRLIAFVKVATEIERTHQLIVNICRRIDTPDNMNTLPSITGIGRLGRHVQRSVTAAMDVLAHENPSKAIQVYHSEEDINHLHETLKVEILNRMATGELTVKTGTDLMSIIDHFERLGDHASNIAKAIYYAHTMQNLRHDAEYDPTPVNKNKTS